MYGSKPSSPQCPEWLFARRDFAWSWADRLDPSVTLPRPFSVLAWLIRSSTNALRSCTLGVGVGVGVGVDVGLGVGVSVGNGVAVGVGVRVGVGEGVGVGVGDGVGATVGVGLGDGVGVTVGVGLGDGVGLTVGSIVGVTVEDAVTVGRWSCCRLCHSGRLSG